MEIILFFVSIKQKKVIFLFSVFTKSSEFLLFFLDCKFNVLFLKFVSKRYKKKPNTVISMQIRT